MAFWDNLLAPFNTDAQEKAAADQEAAARAAYAAYSGLAEQGRGALTSNITAGLQPIQGMLQQGQLGTNQYLRVLGIQAPGDTSAPDMTGLLRSTPGYQFALDQGLESVLRKASQSGSLASGGTNLDLLKFGTGLADQTYQSYLQNLQPW